MIKDISAAAAEYERLTSALRNDRRALRLATERADRTQDALAKSYELMTDVERDAVADDGWKSDPKMWDSRLSPPSDDAECAITERGTVGEWFVKRDGLLICISPGATLWRFYILEGRRYVKKPRYGSAISGHVYDTAKDALDAALAWIAHPYRIP